MSNIIDETVKNCLRYVKHDSGLDIYIYKMDGFSSTSAFFATRYGSVHNRFRTGEMADFADMPKGIAHYLEHKLFEGEECDAFAKFAALGSSSNAYTSFERTAYYFKCSKELFYDSLKILLDFVQHPYFTDENVEKERGIISQEIQMTNDNPDWRVFFNLLDLLYKDHPIKYDIAGTVESIKDIDKEKLYQCYNAFYDLHNMVLVMVGDIDEEKALAIADELLIKSEDSKVVTDFPDDREKVGLDRREEEMEIGTTLFNIGFKCAPKEAGEMLYFEETAGMFLELLADQSSDLYKRLLDEGLINNTFYTEAMIGRGYFSLIFGGESDSPDRVFEEIKSEIAAFAERGVDREHFEELKKSTYGEYIRDLNSVTSVTSVLLSDALDKNKPFERVRVVMDMTEDDIIKFAENEIDIDNSAISILRKKDREDG